jgi:hypothetical protein
LSCPTGFSMTLSRNAKNPCLVPHQSFPILPLERSPGQPDFHCKCRLTGSTNPAKWPV